MKTKKTWPLRKKRSWKALGVFPAIRICIMFWARFWRKLNRFEESIKSMEKVLDIDPQNADALNFIGYSYADRGIHLDEAEQMIVQALKIKPDNGYILDSLGWVHFKKNKYDSALKHLKRALELLPDDPNIMEHLGDVYLKIGQE